MFRPLRFLSDCQRPLIERFRFAVVAFVPVEEREVVESKGDIGCSGPCAFSRIASAR